jgi:hypothetical protein
MSSNSSNPITNCSASSTELIDEYRRQSTLASLADRTDVDLMNFLDAILLDAEQAPSRLLT